MNFLTSKNINDVKKLTLCTTRPDLRIANPITVDCFSPREHEHKSTWKFQNFDYSISELGFRGNTLPTEIDIAAFGCSFTFGQGLAEEMTWPNLLATDLNMTVYNFGQPATGVKNIADLFALLTTHVKIKHAIFLLPPYHRLQVAAKNQRTNSVDIVPILPNYEGSIVGRYTVNSADIYKALPEEELMKIFKDAVYLIDHLSSLKGIRAYYSSWEKDTYKFLAHMKNNLNLLPEWTARAEYTGTVEYLNDDFARDMLHPGPRHHKNWSWKIKDFIK